MEEDRDKSRWNVRREPTGDRVRGEEPERPEHEDEIAEEAEKVRRETRKRHGPDEGQPVGKEPVPRD